MAAAQACGTDNEPTEAARPELAATPPPRPEEPSELPSELIAWTPFCAAVCTAWAAAAGAKPFNIECKVLVIDTPVPIIDMWLLAIELTLLSGDRCGETAVHSPPSLEEGTTPCAGWASCCSAWGTLFINWFAAAVSMASSTATACSRSPPGLVISGASSNGSNASVAVAAVAA
ncbi:Uncharacterised protein [Mycobacterium tuberculosis]|nr:Uncharacterised protein [Mycobacterium tuberculosis]CKW79521.1 Uncharacterised protein [Mycobacterium tuberculosis]